MIVVINYEMGNLASIGNMIRKIGHEALITSKSSDIEKATKLILPGVGSFDAGISHLEKLGLKEVLEQKVKREKTPILGICLGMQLFTRKSDEGRKPGLGWVEADTKRFQFDHSQNGLKIPHMGWNEIHPNQNHPLLEGFEKDPRFYFVHSYHAICDHDQEVLATTHHGYDFTSVLMHENIYGAQFHPEKSHKFGVRLFQNFLEKI